MWSRLVRPRGPAVPVLFEGSELFVGEGRGPRVLRGCSGQARYERSWLRCYDPHCPPGFRPRIEYGAGFSRERRLSWAQGERVLRGCSGQAWYERSWLRCYGPRRPPGFPPPRERRSWGRGTTGELGSGCAPALLGRATPPSWIPALAGMTVVWAGTTGELGSGCAPALLGRATPPSWIPAPYRVRGRLFAGMTVELGSGSRGVGAGCSSRTMCTMSSLAAAILWWVLKPSFLSCMTSSRKSMMVPASAVWARMSLAMRNSSIPERTVRKSRVRVGGAFRGHGHQAPVPRLCKGRPGWGVH